MSQGSDALVSEVASLRRDLAALTARVLVLESERATSSVAAPASPLTVQYNYTGRDLPVTPPLPFSGGGGFASAVAESPTLSSVLGSGSPTQAVLSTVERERIAVEVGHFLRRSLAGENRGSSGRHRLPSPSRYYILCRDRFGATYNPVKIYPSFASLRHSVKDQRGECGDAIFVGLPNLREARLAVEAADLQWPSDA